MFDRIVLGGGTTHHHHRTVVEKRAPTDESVALLKDMQEKALQSLLSFPMNFNGLHCNLYIYHDVTTASSDRRVIVLYQLNGEQHRVDIDLNWSMMTLEQRVTAIRDALAKSIASHMLEQALRDLPDVEKLQLFQT